MPTDTLLWLALLVVLALLFLLTVRRMSALIARTRTLERFQRTVDSVDRRLASKVGPLVANLDEIRRRAGDPAALHNQLAEVQAALDELGAEVGSLPTPTGLAAIATALAADIDRARRAASLVEHGLGAMANTSIGRDLEAQTALKRGALNLRHAQGAFATRAREVAALRPADLLPGAGEAARRVAGDLDRDDGSEDPDGRLDPRM